MLYLQILLVIVSTAGLELRSEPSHVMAGFERTNISDSGGRAVQQTADAGAAQRHYQAGLAALEKNDLAAAEEEMQAAARLAPKDALIFYQLAVIQSKRDKWQPALKNIDVARKLGLPKNLKDEALQLAADVIMKQLQANTAENNKKFAWFDQMEWLQGKYIFTKMLNHDSECVKDYHWIDNILDMKAEYDKSEFSGTLTLRERDTVSETGAAGCADASAASGSSGESKGDSAAAGSKAENERGVEQGFVPRSCVARGGEARRRNQRRQDPDVCDARIVQGERLRHARTRNDGVYRREKRGRQPADFHQRFERWRQGWARRGAIQKAERKPFLGHGQWRFGGAELCQQGLNAVGQLLHAVAFADYCVGGQTARECSGDRVGIHRKQDDANLWHHLFQD